MSFAAGPGTQNKSTGDRPSSSYKEQTDATRMPEFKSSSRIIKRDETAIDCPNVSHVAFIADGEHLVTGGANGRIRRWRVQDGTEVEPQMYAESPVSNIAASRDGKWIVSGAENGEVTVWNAKNHEKTTVIQASSHQTWVRAVDISPDGTKIASGSYDELTVFVWSVTTGKRLLGPLNHKNWVAGAKFSPDGCFLATATWNCNSVRVYNSQDGSLLADFPVRVGSGSNQTLAWWSEKQLFALSFKANIHCLDVSSQTELSKWPIHDTESAWCLSLADNGAFIAASSDSSVSLWDTTTHKQIGSVIQYTSTVRSMAISANHDLVIAGGSKIVLRNLLVILPSPYHTEISETQHRCAEEVRVKKTIRSIYAQYARSANVPISTLFPNLKKPAQDLRIQYPDPESVVEQKEDGVNDTIGSLCAENANSSIPSDEKMANLEETVQDLRDKLAHSQHQADGLRSELADSQLKADHLTKILSAHWQKHQCEILYEDGHIIDAAQSLLEIEETMSEDVRSDTLINNWILKFTNKCIRQLERIGDEASQINNHDEALAAYSNALSLGLSTATELLTKWANTVLLRGSPNEALDVSRKFKVPRFLVYCTICDILEGDGRIQEAIYCFRQMQNEATLDKNTIQDNRAEWELGFRRRCIQKLEKLSDDMMRSGNYKEVVDHLTTILSLDPADRLDMLLKRSEARVMMGSWEDALNDAEEVTKLNPSSYRGYEQKQAALHGAGRHAEAVEAFDTMVLKLKLDQSTDEHGRDLRDRYIDAKHKIQRIVHAIVSHIPRVLIDTTTGRLQDRAQLAESFEALPLFAKLVVSSVTGDVDYDRVRREVTEFYQYAMLSHKWGQGEPLLQDVEHVSVFELKPSPANDKLKMFCSVVRSRGFRWAWSDTCCIDKLNKVVLEESLVAMFAWYRGSALTLVYLVGVLSHSMEPGGLRGSIWNTRAWTYQEYVAANRVQFYTEDWKPYLDLMLPNHKESPIVISEMEQISGQQSVLLQPGLDRVREKLFLASTRESMLVEDMAYSLLGIFNATIAVRYGEGDLAVGRLLEYILTGSGDVTIIAWTGTANTFNSCLPMDLTVYHQLVPPHLPPPMEIGEVDHTETELRSSVTDLDLVMRLYDELKDLPLPTLVASRLRLPGIVFLVDEVVRVSGPDPGTKTRVYRASTTTLGDLEITTTNNLTTMNDLYLVHPWIRPLLDSDHALARAPARRHKTTRALRLLARLMQPFGALLFEQVSRVEYKRVAADSLIMVQIRNDISLDDLMENICTIDVQ